MANKQQSPNPAGRPKGSANKIGQELQAMLKASFSRVGGIEYLVKQAEENPTAYMTMISKLLPKQVEVSGDIGVMLLVKDFTTGGTSADRTED